MIMELTFSAFILGLLWYAIKLGEQPLSRVGLGLFIVAGVCACLDGMAFVIMLFGVIFCVLSVVSATVHRNPTWVRASVHWCCMLIILQTVLYFPLFYYIFGPPKKHYGPLCEDGPKVVIEHPHTTEVDLNCNSNRLFYSSEYRYGGNK